jgi:hypothetical protein
VSSCGPVDVDALLARIQVSDIADDLWGGANLVDGRGYDAEGIEMARSPVKVGAQS